MRDSAPHRLTERRQAILRQTSAALRGRPVTLWRMAKGIAVAEVTSRPTPVRDMTESDVAAALRTWGLTADDRSLWAAADQATVYLCGSLALLEACVERVREMRGLTTTDRAHLLADLAVVAD